MMSENLIREIQEKDNDKIYEIIVSYKGDYEKLLTDLLDTLKNKKNTEDLLNSQKDFQKLIKLFTLVVIHKLQNDSENTDLYFKAYNKLKLLTEKYDDRYEEESSIKGILNY